MIRSILAFLLISIFSSHHIRAEEAWTHLTEINGIEIGTVDGLCIDYDGEIWISSILFPPADPDSPPPAPEYFVFHYNGIEWINESDRFDNHVYDIEIDNNGDVWFSNWDKLVCFSEGVWTQVEAPYTILDIDVFNGTVWCCSPTVFLSYNGTDWNEHTTEEGLKDRPFRVVISPDGEPWVRYGDPYAIDGQVCAGVSHFTGETWETFDTGTGLPSDEVIDIAFDSSGDVYVSYGGGSTITRGVSKYSDGIWNQVSTESGPLLFDNDGNFWIPEISSGQQLTKCNDVSCVDYYQDTSTQITGYGHIVEDNGKLWLGARNGVILFNPSVVVVEDDVNVPQSYDIIQNYPNPFNANTVISYNLNHSAHVTLSIYSMSGQKVATLVDGAIDAGMYHVQFEGTSLASGQYIAKMETADTVKSISMVLIK